MKSRLITRAMTLTASVLLAGCATTPSAPDADPRHPANAHAESSPMPPLKPGLLSLTNVTVAAPAAEVEPEHGHKRGGK